MINFLFNVLTLINTFIFILILCYHLKIIEVEISIDKSKYKNKILSVHIFFIRWYIVIPIRNKYKTERNEEIAHIIKTYTKQQKIDILTTRSYWLGTDKEVEEFRKLYSIVDKHTVENLITNYYKNKNEV